jgi:hypothetical protein
MADSPNRLAASAWYTDSSRLLEQGFAEYPGTTQRYAHLSQDTLLAASNAATLAVGSVMGAMPNRVLDVPLVAA